MTVYYINLLLILGLAWPLCIYKPSRVKSGIYLAVNFAYMWFIATFRYGIGFDYESYIKIFQDIKAAEGFSGLLNQGPELGFTLLTKAMAFFVPNSLVMYGIYAALILIPIAVFIYLWCDNKWLSTWLFVTLTFFYTSMNFIRQSLACSIVALSYGFLRSKKPIPYFAMILLAATFHKTALIMIPVYFVCHLKLGKKLGILYGSMTVLLYIFSETILQLVTRFVFTYYKDSVYVTAFSPVFLLIPFTIFGACLALWPIWQKRDPDSTVLMNLMLYSAIIWLFITRHFILERLSMYVYIFALVAAPAALSCLLASPEEYALRDELRQGTDKKPGKEALAKLKKLNQSISDHQKYYWSAVVALVFLTLCYNEFGSHVNGFHNVFPYQSVLDWLGGNGAPTPFN
ncbi:EpsG family protein [Oscillospiraceae bacterium MB08-C2-2]|nr:EpsG family protein [Oscillospiraceae bacterium MB08-C2-2]